MPFIYCIIIHFANHSLTSACIDSIKKIVTTKFKLKYLVIDNSINNRGFAGGANKGFKQVHKLADYYLLLNNDVILNKHSLTLLIKSLFYKNAGIAGPKILIRKKASDYYLSKGVIDKNRFTAGHEVFSSNRKMTTAHADFVSGSTMLIKRSVLEDIGGFDERYFLYYEDVDFCVRARNKGYSCIFVPDAEVYHKESSSITKADKAYYLARNHLLFVEKYAPKLVKIREFFRLPKTIYEYMSKEKVGKDAIDGVRDYFMHNFGKRK